MLLHGNIKSPTDLRTVFPVLLCVSFRFDRRDGLFAAETSASPANKLNNASGSKRSRLPVVSTKPTSTSNWRQQLPITATATASKFNLPYDHNHHYNRLTGSNGFTVTKFESLPAGQNGGQIAPPSSTRRNLFQPTQQQPSNTLQWSTAAPASEEGDTDSHGQAESVRKYCTEDTPCLSKAGSNTNLSCLTLEDDEHPITQLSSKQAVQKNNESSSDEDDPMEQQLLEQFRKVAWAEKGTSKIAPFRHNKVSTTNDNGGTRRMAVQPNYGKKEKGCYQ